jgi:hypothetical protein
VDGDLAGSTFPLTEGPAVAGRAPDCAICVADPSLSRRHFEITVESEVCRIVDLGSRNGIAVNGVRAYQATVRTGDTVQAGDIVFRLETTSDVHPIFVTTAPSLNATVRINGEQTLLGSLANAVRAHPPDRLYALIDGAQAFELAFAARLMGHDLFTLFSGTLAHTVAQVGPCLVAIDEPSAFLEKWVAQIGRHAGILFESPADLPELCAHLRSAFVATDEEGQEYFFRFYDPRVLRAFLPTCRLGELAEFFGPVTRWIVEQERGTAYTAYSFDESGLAGKEIVADPSPSRVA